MTVPMDAAHEVRLIRFPIAVQARAQEQHAELMREFALLAIDGPGERGAHEVPLRLKRVMDELMVRYAGFGAA
ncbi:MAG: hypothetical protein ABIM89_16770, partial [Mycobacteriales bacterium]